MGQTTLPPGSRIYLDTNVWIYALEGCAEHSTILATLFARIDGGELLALTSELTLAEALVKPFSDRNVTLPQRYLETLQNRESVRIVPITREILIAAARLRAQVPTLKMPDALHAATALTEGIDYFISNDIRLAAVTGLEYLGISGE